MDTTRKQLKIHFVEFSHEYDEWRDYDNKWNYFPFVRLEKMFFPEEGSRLFVRGNIHGQLYRCLIPSISSQLCVQEQILWSAGINRRNEELLNTRKFRNRTV